MSVELFNELERRINSLINVVDELKLENGRLKSENDRLNQERAGLKSRIDSILKKLEGV
ncbi:cell division protein ZapB [Geomonas subterranea]|uniref:Cell division protein ZapB n=1 Tax=Geomonas subterranea TaxID=2847989 RepID=A0ABX8LFG9_9BACT|nr:MULTISPECIES: cell division protein ZapB [Geomonas]QXE90800.1 cell division protein ZapB [Geomonas subterranea]QXM11118.1 cell division protein ZapB [Geomonas subterranea]